MRSSRNRWSPVLVEPEPVQDRLDRRGHVEQFCLQLMAGRGATLHLVDGEWGSGKSVFLKMCAAELQQDEYRSPRVFEFNAWSQSYTKNPLLDLTYYMSAVFSGSRTFRLRRAAKRIAGHVAVGVSDIVASRTMGFVNLKVFFSRSSNEWSLAQQRLKSFQRQLAKLAGPQPLVLLIDEADRCDPSYTVRLLEQVHFLFQVPGVYVVLAVNQPVIESSVQRIHGDQCDASQYLRGIVSRSIRLPGAAARDVSGMVADSLKAAGWADKIQDDCFRAICDILALVPLYGYGGIRNVEHTVALAARLFGDEANLPETTRYSGCLPQSELPVFVAVLVVLRMVSPEAYRRLIQRPTDGAGACELLHAGLDSENSRRDADFDAARCLQTLSTYLLALGGTAEDGHGPVLEGLGLSSPFGPDELAEIREAVKGLRVAHHGADHYQALDSREIEMPIRHWATLVNRALPPD